MRFLIPFLLFTVLAFASPPPPGSKVYTIQVASYPTKEEALEFAKRLPPLPYLRISYYKGRYRVRVGLFKSLKEAREFAQSPEFRELFKDFFIARTAYYPSRVTLVEPLKPVELPPLSSLVSVEFDEVKPVALPSPSSLVEVAGYSEVLKAEPQKEGGVNLPLYALIPAAVAGGAILLKLRRSRPFKGSVEALVGELLSKGRYGEVVEVALPLILSGEGSLFLKKALAESYEKLGRYLEAAELYEEVAKELERRGLSPLALELEAKAQELYGREFKG